MKTLTKYVEDLIKKYELKDDFATKKRIRQKAMRVLQKHKEWDKATIEIVNDKAEKKFNGYQLDILNQEMIKYLNVKDNVQIDTTSEVTNIMKIEAMVEALFKEHFVLDLKKWNKDLKAQQTATKRQYTTIKKRLDNPVDSYVTKKEQ